MYCKNCGKEVQSGAVVCLSCGFDPLSERNYCQNCGTKTDPKQIVCVKCGHAIDSKSGSAKTDAYKGMYRSSDQKVFAGVCGGLAHKTGAPLVLWRIITFFLGFLLWIPFIIYIILALVTPAVPTKNVVIK